MLTVPFPIADPKSGEKCYIDTALLRDASAIQAMVVAAYQKYTERIDTPPAPMLQDYAKLIETSRDSGVNVLVLHAGKRDEDEEQKVVGSIIIGQDKEDETALKINNIVVDPAFQGRGYGKVLLQAAEQLARMLGLRALTLFTNVKMHENIAWYTKIGFVETGRKTEGSYERVYFRRDL